MRINTNVYSIQAQRQLGRISQALARSLERLASGQRVSRAGDDVSGLALSTGLKAQSLGLAQVARNINQSFGYLNAADSALGSQMDLLQRMRELAVQSASGTLSNSERSNLELEFRSLYTEFETLTEKTQFNGNYLLNGDFEDLGIQVGLNKGEQVDVSLESTEASGVFYRNTTQSSNGFGPAIAASGMTAAYTNGARLAQIDSDGKADLYYQETDALGDPTGIISLYRGTGTGAFEAWKTFNFAAGTSVSFGQDFNADGLFDMIKDTGSGIEILLQSEDGDFDQQVLATGLALTGLTYTDLDGDGDTDIWGRNSTTSVLHMYVNQGNGVFSAAVTAVSVAGAAYHYMKDLNGDGYSDYISSASGTTTVHLNNGNGSFSNPLTRAMTVGFTARDFSDYDGDGDLDMLTRNATNGVVLWKNDGTGSFSAPNTEAHVLNFAASGFRTEDINNDGRMDYVGVQTNGDLITRLGQADGTFSTGTTVNFGFSVNRIDDFSDLNGDGLKEVLVSRSTTGVYGLALNQGSGNFSLSSTIYSGSVSGSISFDDLNEDGTDDLILRSNTTGGVQFNTGGLSFSSTSIFATQGTTLAYQLIDIDGDGFRDASARDSSAIPGNEQFSIQLQRTQIVEEFVNISIETQEDATAALEVLDHAMTEVTDRRAHIGAQQNRLESALNSTLITFENLEAARSQVIDADIASESAELVKNQILQQAATSVLLQANSSLKLILALLRP